MSEQKFTYKCRMGDKYMCPHMKAVEDDSDMGFEHYECKVCGERYKLDYDEMR